eukprot:TRINITY_DN9195_c0_g2_i1.p1 TRINITY_DN9195_c0_g2~~TRINITY_DN9195_c0_g2_i1.p1  ORF type:complete len:389 (+),score=59.87 TRINITY_DN9195_c0_g2_i1:225-1391(+)
MQIFERMEKQMDGSSTVDEFIKVFLQAEAILKQKVLQIDKRLRDYQKQRAEAETKLEEVRKKEKINNYGIMEGSTLTVTILEAQNLQLEHLRNPLASVVLKLEEQVQNTQNSRRNENPLWNETFTFDVKTGVDDLQVAVLVKTTYDEIVVGRKSISLKDFKDQQRHEEWYDMRDENHQSMSSFRLKIAIQWINSRVRYLNDVLNKWEEYIRGQHEEKLEIANDLNELYTPFPILRPPNGPDEIERIRQRNNDLEDGRVKLNPRIVNSKQLHNANWATYIFIIQALMINFYRADHLSLCIPLYYFMVLLSSRLTPKALRFSKLLIAISVGNDILWLIVNSKHWWFSAHDPGDCRAQQGIKRFVILFSWLQLLLKGVLFTIYHKLDEVFA